MTMELKNFPAKINVKFLFCCQPAIIAKLSKIRTFYKEDNLMQSDVPEENKPSRRKEYEKLIKKQKELEKDLNNLEKKCDQSYEMALLHKYNEIKDAAQILLGAIANIEGVTVKELHERFELPIND